MTQALPSLGDRIKARALECFDGVGIAAVGEPSSAPAHYEAWLAAGFHGDMAYLATERNRQRRADLDRVLPGVRSVICVALCYPPELDAAQSARLGRIARYAGGEDYHRIMRDHLRSLEDYVVELLPRAKTLAYSDTGAILERAWAERAGLGWIGKHSGLLSQRIGSYFLLGELLVDQPLDADPPVTREHCGTCHRCIDACPTQAIVEPYRVDARRCISYLTIELRGPIPRELRPLVGDWIFGCDVCQDVCPWNRFAPPAREARLHAHALEGWTLERFLTLDEDTFARLFAHSPIRRARRSGFLRNVCVALGNRRDPSAATALSNTLAADPEPLVRGHAAWALGVIGSTLALSEPSGRELVAALREATADGDAFVEDEARAALTSLAGRR